MTEEPSRIRRQHEILREQTDELLGILKAGRDWENIEMKLGRLAATLSNHFQIEELGGYLSNVMEAAPDKAPVIRRLRGAHDDLWGRLQLLIARARSRDDPGSFGSDLTSWIQRLKEHEERENALLASVSEGPE